MRMCGNARLQKIHRLALVYAKKYLNRIQGVNDLMCEECQFAVAELKTLVEERGTQTEIRDYIRNYVCKHMGQYQGMCDELVDQFLPELFQELDQFLQNSKQVCTDMGLCTGQNVLVNGQSLHPADNTNARNVPKTYRLKSFWRMLNNLQTKSGMSMPCIECDGAVAVILTALHLDTVRKGLTADLQGLACDDILPTDFQAGCNDFFSLYLETVYTLTVNQFTAPQICTMLHMCDPSKSLAISRMTATQKAGAICESCKGITDYVRSEMSDSAFVGDIEFGLQKYLCSNLPQSLQNLCENVIKSYTPIVMQKIARLLNSDTICKDDLHMCTSELLQQIGHH